MKDCWEKEASEVWDDITKQAGERYEKALAHWEKKKKSFTGSPEDFNQ